MALRIQCHHCLLHTSSTTATTTSLSSSSLSTTPSTRTFSFRILRKSPNLITTRRKGVRKTQAGGVISAALDLTEDNIRQVLLDARTEFAQIFDTSVGMTGVAELAEVDGPFVKIRLRGRFWHERSVVIARLGNYLKQKIPEILEVDIEDEKQLDDSPANF